MMHLKVLEEQQAANLNHEWWEEIIKIGEEVN